MATKKTYINADQELVIQGKLTIEGEVVQQEDTVKVNNLQSDELVINSDGQNTTAKITLNSNNSLSSMSFADGGNIVAEPGLQGNLFVASGQSIIIDGGGSIGGTGFTGNLTGTASNANALTSAVTLNLSGDATGSTTFINAGDNSTIATTLVNTGVSAGTYGTSNDVAQFTVDTKGRISAAGDVAIDHDALLNFVADEHIAHSGVTLTAGAGLTGGGDITTSRTFNVVGGNGITVNADDIITDDTYIKGLFSATDSGGDGSFSYSNGVFTYTGPSASEVRAHFTGGYGITLSSGDISLTNSEVQAQANVAIGNNSNIVLTDNTQSISGSKTFTSDVEIQGNLNVTANINSSTQVDLFVEDTSITLRSGANSSSDGNANINVDRASATTYLLWNDIADRWQFSNDGSTDNNMLLMSDFSGGTGITFSNGAISTTDADIVHDNLSGFEANEHIDHTTVSVTAGTGLTGGGTIASTKTLNVIGGDGITANADDIEVDSTVIRTTGDQSLAGQKTFTGNLLIPTTDVSVENAIFTDSNEAWVYVNGSKKQITPTSSIGSAEEANSSLTYTNVGTTGTSTFEVYAGQRTVGADTFHAIKGLEAGSNVLITNNATALTIDANIASIYEKFSVVSGSGDGSLSYNNTNGTFTYTGPTPAEVRSHITGSGLIGYNSGTGVISTSADNFANWQFTTDSAGNQQITSGGLLTFTAGSGIDVTHSGSTITIATDSDADISGVQAGDGLTGGGVSGTVTLNVAGGYGITANANDIEVANSDIRGLFSAGGDLSYNASSGVFSFTNDAGDIEGVTAGFGLSGGGTSGTVSLELANTSVRGLFSASGDISYNSSTGVFSFTNDAGDIEGVTAGVGLSGGGTSGTVSLALDFSELTDMTGDISGTTEFILQNGTTESRKAASEIKISNFNNDSGFTTNVGDITAVVAGTNLNGGASSGSATVNLDTALTGMTSADFSGNVDANFFVGTATQARYADLAENYVADADYEPGTVLILGGDHEVTVTDEAGSYKAVGIVSTDPAHLMNVECEGEHVVAVALRGRVPCKVIGNVNKGDVLVASDTPGYAMVGSMPHTLSPLQIVGRSLETKTDAQPGVIEILV